jgi:hypothetical protein
VTYCKEEKINYSWKNRRRINFGGTRDWTQSPMCVKQAVYYWSHVLCPFAFSYFADMASGCNSSTSTSWVVGVTGIHQHTQPIMLNSNIRAKPFLRRQSVESISEDVFTWILNSFAGICSYHEESISKAHFSGVHMQVSWELSLHCALLCWLRWETTGV